MYGLGGERRLIEWEVPWLPGFDGARPARVGITDNERGEVRLTALGRRIADSAQETVARVDAFMNVPLYDRIFKNYEGFHCLVRRRLRNLCVILASRRSRPGERAKPLCDQPNKPDFLRMAKIALSGPHSQGLEPSQLIARSQRKM